MTMPDFEQRLTNALQFAATSRSIVDDVMRQLPAAVPTAPPRFGVRTRVAAEIGVAAVILLVVGSALLFNDTEDNALPAKRPAAAKTAAPNEVMSASSVLESINKAHDSFLKKYRAIVWIVSDGRSQSIDSLDVIWRDGQKLRQNHHLPLFEIQENQASPLPPLEADALLTWSNQTTPSVIQLMDKSHEYVRESAAVAGNSRPKVRVNAHDRIPLLDQNSWPEHVQWPTRNVAPQFELLAANAETPEGCIGLRYGSEMTRRDVYVDPRNDYVCVKQTHWTNRDGEWVKSRESTLSQLRRVSGRVVAGQQHIQMFADPVQDLAANAVTKSIDVVPLTEAEFPPGIFDPAALTEGADVERK